MLVQKDAPLIIRRALRDVADVPVRSELPDKWSPRDGPVIAVVGDGTPHTEKAWTRENVRVAVVASDEPTARDLAIQCDAYLLDPRNTLGLSIFPGAGLVTVRDTKLGGWIAAVTVRAATNRKEQS